MSKSARKSFLWQFILLFLVKHPEQSRFLHIFEADLISFVGLANLKLSEDVVLEPIFHFTRPNWLVIVIQMIATKPELERATCTGLKHFSADCDLMRKLGRIGEYK